MSYENIFRMITIIFLVIRQSVKCKFGVTRATKNGSNLLFQGELNQGPPTMPHAQGVPVSIPIRIGCVFRFFGYKYLLQIHC